MLQSPAPEHGNRTVTLALLILPPFGRGKCTLSVFVFSGRFGVLCFFAVFLFLGSLFGRNFGNELVFSGVGAGLVFFDGVLPRFLVTFWHFAPETVRENFLTIRLEVITSIYLIWRVYFNYIYIWVTFIFLFEFIFGDVIWGLVGFSVCSRKPAP